MADMPLIQPAPVVTADPGSELQKIATSAKKTQLQLQKDTMYDTMPKEGFQAPREPATEEALRYARKAAREGFVAAPASPIAQEYARKAVREQQTSWALAMFLGSALIAILWMRK